MLNAIGKDLKIHRTHPFNDEVDITAEKIVVRCGPYDNSDIIEILRTDEGEYQVLYHSDKNGSEDPDASSAFWRSSHEGEDDA
jgi:hypothetical protein